MAIQEHVGAIGVSFLGGGHLFYTDRLLKLLKENDMMNVVLFAGCDPPQGCRETEGDGGGCRLHPGRGATSSWKRSTRSSKNVKEAQMKAEEKLVSFVRTTRFEEIPSIVLETVKNQLLAVPGPPLREPRPKVARPPSSSTGSLEGRRSDGPCPWRQDPCARCSICQRSYGPGAHFCDSMAPGTHPGAAVFPQPWRPRNWQEDAAAATLLRPLR